MPHASGLHVGSWVGSVMPKNLKRYYGRGDLHFETARGTPKFISIANIWATRQQRTNKIL